MAVTYGFYNSINSDRVYNATDFSKQFDGIISDGVFANIDSGLTVAANTGMQIFVNKGKAWFNHTWTINDAVLPLTVTTSDLTLPRIDAVILEINSATDKRLNRIYIKKGTASKNPAKPTMTHTDTLNQYALAYISVKANVSEIKQSDITNAVGTTATPFVTGLLKVMDATSLYAQWQAQFLETIAADDAEFRSWYNAKKAEIQAWYDNLVEELSQSQAVNLQNQINDINGRLPVMSYGTANPSSSTPGYGTNGSLYYKIIS